MLIHWMWLANRPGLSDRQKKLLLESFDDPEDIYFAEKKAYACVEGLTEDAVAALEDKNLNQAEHILKECMNKGIHILTMHDAAYPARLKHIADPPVVLKAACRISMEVL